MMKPDKNDVVIIELDRPRELRLGHKALKRFSALAGCAMTELDEVTAHYDKLSALMYIMLSENDPAVTPDVADELLDAVNLSYIMEKASEAIAAAFEEDAEEDVDAPPMAAGTGVRA